MRQFCSVLLLGCTCLVLSAQEGATGPWANKFFTGKDTAPPPVIQHNFGTVPQGTVKVHRFTLSNLYAVRMDIVELKPSCNCISISDYTRQLEPMQKGFLEVKIDTSKVTGFKRVSLPITFAGTDPKTKEVFKSTAVLELTAVSRADIVYTPGSINFGQIAVGTTTQPKSLVLTYQGTVPNWQIDRVTFNKEMLEVTAIPRWGKTGKLEYVITATLSKDAPVGDLDEQITLETNDRQNLTVSVQAIVRAPLSILPSNNIAFQNIIVGEKDSRNIIVRASKEFKIIRIDGQTEEFTASPGMSIGGVSQSVSISCQPATVGLKEHKLTIVTDLGSLDVSVSATGVAK
ncbi:MAG: DUF1573 domain-containing protein [Zavarzinella sp.]